MFVRFNRKMKAEQSNSSGISILGGLRYQLLLLRGRLYYLKAFLLEGDPEAYQEYGQLIREEVILSEAIAKLTEVQVLTRYSLGLSRMQDARSFY